MALSADMLAVAPVAVLAAAGCCCLLAETFSRRGGGRTGVLIAGLAGLALAAAAVILPESGGLTPAASREAFAGAIVNDGVGAFGTVVVLVGAAMAMLSSPRFLAVRGAHYGEYYALILFAACGMALLTVAGDLITLFLALEIMSLSVYVLCGYLRSDERSNESAMKYLVMGGFSTGLLLLGMAFLYGLVGSVRLADIAALRLPDQPLQVAGAVSLADPQRFGALGVVAAGLVLSGLLFKVGAVPFQFWVPDVYEGAPTPVTGFMATAVKTASFVALARLLGPLGVLAAPGADPGWFPLSGRAGDVVLAAAVLTLLVGNVAAVAQRNVKRMIAYSSIAHTGYLLLGVIVILPAAGAERAAALASMLFYLFAYTLATSGVFAGISLLEPGDRALERFDDFRGLGRGRLGAGLALTVFMLSLAGIPLTGGFMAKFSLFTTLIDAGHTPLAVFAIVMSLVSIYYYLRIVVAMFFQAPPSPVEEVAVGEAAAGFEARLATALCLVGTLLLGVAPQWFFQQAAEAARAFYP